MKEKKSLLHRLRHFLAWDEWIVRRELPEGFRLRRYVAWNAVGALCGLAVLGAAVAVVLSVPPKGVLDRLFMGGRYDNKLAPCWLFLGGCLGLAAVWLLLHCGSRADIRRTPHVRQFRKERVVCLVLLAVTILTVIYATVIAPVSPGFVLSGAVLLFVAFLFYRVAFSPRTLFETRQYGWIDSGRILAGFARPTLLLWTFYIAATPIRPLDLHPVPPERIPDWLKDETGNLVRPRDFLVSDMEGDWRDQGRGWSNLVERVGDPLPTPIRLMYEMRECDVRPHDKCLGFEAGHRLIDIFAEASRTNAISFFCLPDEFRDEVNEWMDVCRKRLSRYGLCTARQTWRFVATNEPLFAAHQYMGALMPSFREDALYVRADLLFHADSGSAEQFLDAAMRTDSLQDAYLQVEDNVVFSSVVLWVDSVKVIDIIRFCERTDINGESFSSVRTRIRESHSPSRTRSTVRALCLAERLTPSLERPIYGELGSCFWEVPIFPNPPPNAFMRRIGELTMLVAGCDYQGFLAGEENLLADKVVRYSSMIDPGTDERNEAGRNLAHGGESCLLWKIWRRGGLPRSAWTDFHLDCSFESRIIKAIFADAFPAVEDAALLLAQFRAEEGRDAESLAAAAQRCGAEVPDTGSAFVELRYERIAPPEGAVPGSSAYALALVPKATAPEWFRSTDRIGTWSVVRNPSFPGTRPSRIYSLFQSGYDQSVQPPSDAKILAAAEGTPAAGSARLVLPAALFGSDPEAIDAAERAMEEAGWTLQ